MMGEAMEERKYFNATEQVVEQSIDKYIKAMGCCTCEQCRTDIICIVLNKLTVHYVSTAKGALFVKLDLLTVQLETDILKEMTSAIKFIKAHPHHTISDPAEK